MNKRPRIETERLILTPFKMDDIPGMNTLASDREDIVTTTSDSEVPLPEEVEEWVKVRKERFGEGESFDFAVFQRELQLLIGTIGLGIEYKGDESMQLGYLDRQAVLESGILH